MDDTNIQNIGDILQYYLNALLFYIPRIFAAIVLIVVSIFIASQLGRLVKGKLTTRLSDPLVGVFITNLTRWIIILFGIMVAMQIAGFSGLATGLLTGAGVSAIIIGFAFKDIGENFLAGIMLAFNRPFNVQDTIRVKDLMGKVQGLSLRNTHIKTSDGRDIFIPNSIIIKEPLTNFTRDGLLRIEFIIGIDHDKDIDAAIEVIKERLSEEKEILKDDPFFVSVDEFTPAKINLKIFFWINSYDYKKSIVMLRGKVMKKVKEALQRAGF
jgi:small conductance mechanosensitive channel